MEVREILLLAESRTPEDRERLMLALISMCEGAAADQAILEPAIQMMMNSIFMTLVADAEKRIRQTLSEHLATAGWAPPKSRPAPWPICWKHHGNSHPCAHPLSAIRA